MPDQYIIDGTITLSDGDDRAGIRVQAFDRDLPSRERRTRTLPQVLGEAVADAEGRFQITYTLEQFRSGEGISVFRRVRKENADLSISVFDQNGQELRIKKIEARDPLNREYRSDQIIFNAPASLEVNIILEAPPAVGDSEYEQLIALIAPVILDLPLNELSDDDIIFLTNELDLEQQRNTQQHLDWLRRCALLARETELPTEAFYGWGRENVPAAFGELARINLAELSQILEKLLAFTDDELQKTLQKAVSEKIIPARFRDGLADVTAQIKASVENRSLGSGGDGPELVPARVSGRLLEARTGMTLSGYSVHATLREGQLDGQELGDAVSGSDGRFDFTDLRLNQASSGQEPGVLIEFLVRDPQGLERLKTEVRVEVNADPLIIYIPRLGDQPPPSVKVEDLAAQGGLDLSPWLSARLLEHGMHTLEDVWAKGGAAHLAGLPTGDRETARLIDAHADLYRLSPDVRANASLIEDHYDSTVRIAADSQDVFFNQTRGVLGDVGAAELYASAQAERNVLRNFMTGALAEKASDVIITGPLRDLLPGSGPVPGPSKCSCRECETAASPLAYLTDLLDYTLAHLRLDNKPVTLDWLEATFHQPFGDLPADCEAMDAMIRQVRLCVEVLRRELAGKVLKPAAATRLATAESAYRLAAYQALLERLGTSYEGLRLARDADPKERDLLAGRLGFTLQAARPDQLDALLLDPAALTEADLERIFGLVDTNISRDRLSDGLVLGAPLGDVTRWNLQGIVWRRTTDDEGLIHVSMRRLGSGVVRVELYRDKARTAPTLVAAGERPDKTGPVALSAQNDSGLSGSIEIHYTADSATLSLAAVPLLLAWRLAELRSAWEQQERPTLAGLQPMPPSIDPDLIGPADLRDPLTGAAADLWQARRKEVDDLLANIRNARLAAATPADALDAALLHPQALGKSSAELAAIEAERQAGTDIRSQLAVLQLSQPAFDFLIQIGQLVSTIPPSTVLDSEWAAVDAILAQVHKIRQADTWRSEEAVPHITLGPDFFVRPGPLPLEFPPQQPSPLPDWLATRAGRRDWERTLQARIDQQQATLDGFHQVVSAAEEATIIALRDALILPAGTTGDVELAAKQLTDRLLIDCANGACQMTTRIAQAIETVQVLLFSVRTGQLNDTFPKLTLNAPYFDREWDWIGSYAPWRAAMLVFMYPENVLHPALRDRQSPAFRRLVRDSRALPEITPETACQLAANYAAYFQDVCKLEVKASIRALTRVHRGTGCRDRSPVEDRRMLHMFAMPANGHTVYWSTFDTFPDPQSFWDWVPGLQQEQVLEIIGATTYNPPSGARLLYVFAKAVKGGSYTLLFTRYDLLRGTWETGNTSLELPQRGADFNAMLIPRAENQPPRITVRQPPEGVPGSTIYQRSLNLDGNGWAEGDWFPQYFSPWYRIGSLTAQPGTKVAAFAPEQERLDLFAVGQDNSVNHAKWDLNGWTGWDRVDNAFSAPAGSPVTVNGVKYALEIFVVGFDNRLWMRSAKIQPSGLAWDPWFQVGTPANVLPFKTEVSVIFESGTSLVLMLDKDGAPLAARRDFSSAFDPWYVAGFPDTGGRFPPPVPVAVVTDFGYFHVGMIGFDGRFYTSSSDPTHGSENWWGWRAWKDEKNLTFPLRTPVTAVSRKKGRFDVFAVGTDGSIQTLWSEKPQPVQSSTPYEPAKDWFRIGGLTVPIRTPIAALGREPEHMDLFVIAEDGRVNHAWWDANENDGEWNDWFPISAPNETFPVRAPISVLARKPGHIDLFAVGNDGGIYGCWWDQDPNAQWPQKPFVEMPAMAIKPKVTGPFELTEQLNESELQIRRAQIRTAYEDNLPGSFMDPSKLGNQRRNVDYLDEAYYFVPMLLAQQLQSDRHFIPALDWYRSVYDYSMPVAKREIAYLLGLNKDWAHAYQRAEDWLEDPLNPHRIAATRPRAYARYTILTLARCFLEAGDDEYTLDTNESIPLARTYYLTALELVDTPELSKQPGGCEVLVGEVDLELGEGHMEAVFNEYKKRLYQLDDRKAVEKAVGLLNELKQADNSPRERLLQASKIVQAAEEVLQPRVRVADVLESSANFETQAHAALLAVPEIEQAARQAARLAGDRVLAGAAAATGMSITALQEERPALSWLDGVRDDSVLVPDLHQPPPAGQNGNGHDSLVAEKTPWHYFDIVAKPDEVYVPAPSLAFCVPPNPVLKTLRLRAQLNLYMLRNCRNIAGMERQLDPYTAPTDPGTGMPSLSDSGQMIVPGLTGLRPTPYHYTTLLERAKQLAQMAGQFEVSMLAAIEKRDAESYTILKARQDAELMRSQVRLQDLRIIESESGVRLAQLQQERTEIELDHWQELLQEDVSELEQDSINALYTASALYAAAAVSSAIAGGTVSFASGLSFGSTNASDAASAYSSLGQIASTSSQILSLQASYERRRQEWQYQRKLAQADVQIAGQSVTIAQNHLRVTQEERLIAGLQADHATAVVEFLTNKFTSADLYDWMGSVLEQVYRWFLQQATAMARLAAIQLGFERQEVPPPFIQANYWDPPSDPGTGSGQAANRRGLTGSARLLQDIYQLDQHAFEKNVRKLHLTKTISLGQMAPVELQRFRHTGVLPFATTLQMFDRDFPGHYLRLIKSVRTTVIALVPPSQGIRATLTCTGSSRAVVGGHGGPLETVVVRRDPQLVALSSALNASGVFDLDPQPELLMPFEGLGVETHWELRMLPASNPFDYRTIADVLVTIEYTALHSYEYARQIMSELGRETSGDRTFSFTHELSDAWCDLHTPDQTAAPMTVHFKTTRADFPPNLDRLKIQNVTLVFTFADDEARTIEVDSLQLIRPGVAPVGGSGSTTDGVISTRRGNPTWMGLIGQDPVGDWELAMPNTPKVRGWFAEEKITEILLVITYSGETPAWPA